MWTTNHDVWTVPVTGGAAKKVTPNPAADMQPTFSPDGKSIARAGPAPRRDSRPTAGISTSTIARRGAQAHRVRDRPTCRSTISIFSPRRRTIWFAAAEDGAENLYTVPAAGGSPSWWCRAARSARSSRRRIRRLREVHPGRAHRAVPGRHATAPTRQLTNENAGWLGRVDLPKPASLTVTGAGGTPVQYWLLKPPNFDPAKKYPVVFLIHGGPQGDWADGWSYRWNPALWAAQGWIVAAPNPRGSTGFGQKFVDEISQDWCGKVMTDLDAVFDAVVEVAQRRSTAHGHRGRELRRLRRRLAHRPHQPIQGGREPRRRLQPRVDVARDRRALVHRLGIRRAAVERHGARRTLRAARRTFRPTRSERRRW